MLFSDLDQDGSTGTTYVRMGQNTRELWSKRVERWKDSGLSAREFASEMGINPHTLSYWRWKLGQKATKVATKKKPAGFVEVVTATSAPVSACVS